MDSYSTNNSEMSYKAYVLARDKFIKAEKIRITSKKYEGNFKG